MEQPVIYLQQRLEQDWLIGEDSSRFATLVNRRSQDLCPFINVGTVPTVLLAEVEPVAFLAGFMAACAAGCPVFLGNPNWAESEWQQVGKLVQPQVIWGRDRQDRSLDGNGTHSHAQSGWIMIPTGGSSGQVRFAIHTWATLMASVKGFQQYFGCDRINSCCVLPLYHVSGLMQFLRSFTSGGRLALLPFKALEAGIQPAIDPSTYFLSLVPTQLQRLLHQSTLLDWLASVHTVLLGGAPAWSGLLEQARHHRIRLAPTYGMTETASQVATLKPEDFLQGHHSCGHSLPHAQITIRDGAGQVLEQGRVGIVTIQAASLTLGYYPICFPTPPLFQPDDLGVLNANNELIIVGRSSNKIITGGENVFPDEVEAAIRSTHLVQDVCVIGLPDSQWGEAIAAIYVPIDAARSTHKSCGDVEVEPHSSPIPHSSPLEAELKAELRKKLSHFKQPKHWLTVEYLPRNAQGKINRQYLQTMAIAMLKSGG